MTDTLVICSSPVNDNKVGLKYKADFTNIIENDWHRLSEKIKTYKNVILEHNCEDRDSLFKLVSFANTHSLTPPDHEYSFYVNETTNSIIDENEILFIGCSHTAGRGHINLDTVYTHQLSNLLNFKPLVDAHPAKGNTLLEEKLQTYNLTNSRVVLQYTDIFRLNLNGENVQGIDYSRAQSSVFTDEVLASEFVERVKRITNLLRMCNSKFVFFQVSHDYPLKDEVVSILSKYDEFVDIQGTMVDVVEDRYHLGPNTHQLWAEKIFNKNIL